ncbi:MAG: homoserine kinase [Dehalococcoidia bacterium]|nr:homoserine kinase [Dehalococcoidia bacterium]
MINSKVVVKAPASSGNMGTGFDCLGMALDWFAEFQFTFGSDIEDEDRDNHSSSTQVITSMASEAARHGLSVMGEPQTPLSVIYKGDMPVGSGLGTSAMARSAGVIAAAEVLGRQAEDDELFAIALELEGHADNLYPAFYGGIQLAIPNSESDGLTHLSLQYADDLEVVLLIPDFSMPTDESREIIPELVNITDAVHNMSRVALLVTAFYERRYELLGEAFRDVLHQPVRSNLFPAMYSLLEAATGAGAYGSFLSGGGSTVAALSAPAKSQSVLAALRACASENGLGFQDRISKIGGRGAYIFDSKSENR